MMRRVFSMLAVLAVLSLAAPGLAQVQPADRSPGPSAPASEAQVPLYMPETEALAGYISIPDRSLAVLVQPEGRDWRAWRDGTLPWIVGGLMVAMLLALAAFYLVRGRIPVEGGLSGMKVLRFNTFDRFGHWLTAVSFIVLALTGLVVTLGRWLLIPLIGHQAFYPLAAWSKAIHNYTSIAFVVGLVIIFALWVRDNLPAREDIGWLKTGGGLFSRHGMHPECGRFNAGQKLIFWSVVLGGLALAVTGFLLLNPFAWTDVDGMQTVHLIHGILAGIMIAIILAHIYIGSLGMQGAFDAMGSGEVDENWARDHHRRWYERQVRRGYADTSPPRGGAPAE